MGDLDAKIGEKEKEKRDRERGKWKHREFDEKVHPRKLDLAVLENHSELSPQRTEGDSCSLIFPRKTGERLNFDPSCDVSSDCYSRIIPTAESSFIKSFRNETMKEKPLSIYLANLGEKFAQTRNEIDSRLVHA